jgi:hypothetical protein
MKGCFAISIEFRVAQEQEEIEQQGRSLEDTVFLAACTLRVFPKRVHLMSISRHHQAKILHLNIADMALLVDKHRPRSLDSLTYHHDLSERLRSLVCRS